MKRILKLKTSHKVLIISLAVIIVASTVLLTTQFGASHNALNDAVEGGELTITSVSRNHESLGWFVKNNNTEASQLLEAARSSLDTARAKFTSAMRTDDDYVRNMVSNYQLLAGASDIMAKGIDNLLIVGDNLTKAFDYYAQQDYRNASRQAGFCLSVLEPLQANFNKSDANLGNMSISYIPSGQRDRIALGIGQYRNEMAVYNQIILILKSIIEGKDYLQLNAQLEESMRQLQSALSNNDYQGAQALLNNMNATLQQLRNQTYQNAADLASQLNPDQLGGNNSDIAQKLKDRLRDLQGLDAYQKYLQALEKYLDALKLFNEGKLNEAQDALNQGLGILGNDGNMDQELQGMYQGLRDSYSALQMRIRGQPDQG